MKGKDRSDEDREEIEERLIGSGLETDERPAIKRLRNFRAQDPPISFPTGQPMCGATRRAIFMTLWLERVRRELWSGTFRRRTVS